MNHAMTVELHPNVYTMMSRASMFLPESVRGFFVLAKLLFEEFLCWFTIPVEVLIRRRIGVRALSMLVVIPLVAGAVTFALLLRGIMTDPLFSAFALGSAGFAVYHAWVSRKWEAGGGKWRHTYSNGDPLELWTRLAPLVAKLGLNPLRQLTPARVVRFYEPALCLILGLILLLVSKLLGGFLIAASIALLFKAQIRHQRFVDAVRDRNDAMLAGEQLAAMPNRMESSTVSEPFVAKVAVALPGEQRADDSDVVEAEALPADDSDVIEAEALPDPEPPPPRSVVRCHACRATLRLKPGVRAKEGPCPKCKTRLRVPTKRAV